jgi:hypothetical protein
MDASSYISDLERLTHNPDDEVKMSSTAYKILLRNIDIINNNQQKIDKMKRELNMYFNQNSDLIQEVNDILTSIKPKKKYKYSTKSNLIPFQATMTEERYNEELYKAPKAPLTPVPDFRHIMNKINSIISSKLNISI